MHVYVPLGPCIMTFILRIGKQEAPTDSAAWKEIASCLPLARIMHCCGQLTVACSITGARFNRFLVRRMREHHHGYLNSPTLTGDVYRVARLDHKGQEGSRSVTKWAKLVRFWNAICPLVPSISEGAVFLKNYDMACIMCLILQGKWFIN